MTMTCYFDLNVFSVRCKHRGLGGKNISKQNTLWSRKEKQRKMTRPHLNI